MHLMNYSGGDGIGSRARSRLPIGTINRRFKVLSACRQNFVIAQPMKSDGGQGMRVSYSCATLLKIVHIEKT